MRWGLRRVVEKTPPPSSPDYYLSSPEMNHNLKHKLFEILFHSDLLFPPLIVNILVYRGDAEVDLLRPIVGGGGGREEAGDRHQRDDRRWQDQVDHVVERLPPEYNRRLQDDPRLRTAGVFVLKRVFKQSKKKYIYFCFFFSKYYSMDVTFV